MLRVYCYKTMTIEKTYKLTIKDAAYFLTEQEVTALYEQCRQALNISVTNPNWPTYDKTTPTYPSWPTYPGTGNPDPLWHIPYVTSNGTDNSVMDSGTSISTANVPSSKGINFLSDDMETIKDNNKWRSSVQQALDKLSAKTNVTDDKSWDHTNPKVDHNDSQWKHPKVG